MKNSKKKTVRTARFVEQQKAPPFVQIAVSAGPSFLYDVVCGLDRKGRVWELSEDGWKLIDNNIARD